MDIIIAMIVLIISFFAIYGIISHSASQSKDLDLEAERISHETLQEESSLNIIDEEELNESKVFDLAEDNYSKLKSKLQVDEDFCIYFEDEDGNIVGFIDPDTGEEILGIGSDEIEVNDIPCKMS